MSVSAQNCSISAGDHSLGPASARGQDAEPASLGLWSTRWHLQSHPGLESWSGHQETRREFKAVEPSGAGLGLGSWQTQTQVPAAELTGWGLWASPSDPPNTLVRVEHGNSTYVFHRVTRRRRVVTRVTLSAST